MVIHTKKNHTITLDDSAGGEKISIVDKSGSNSVEIDSNQNSIAVKSGLKLTIESQVIEIKAGGTMKLEASGTMTIKGAVVMMSKTAAVTYGPFGIRVNTLCPGMVETPVPKKKGRLAPA